MDELLSVLVLHWVGLQGQECIARTAGIKGFRTAEELPMVNPDANIGMIHMGKVLENQTSKRAVVPRGRPMGIQTLANQISRSQKGPRVQNDGSCLATA